MTWHTISIIRRKYKVGFLRHPPPSPPRFPPVLLLLLTFHELAAATTNFSSSYHLTPSNASSSYSFHCSLRGHPTVVFCRSLRRDPHKVSTRLAVLGHCHHVTIMHLLGTAASPDQSLFLAYELIPECHLLSALLCNPKNPSFTPLSFEHSRLQLAAEIYGALHYVHLQADTIHNRLSSSIIVCCNRPLFRTKIAHFSVVNITSELSNLNEEQGSGEINQGHRRTGSQGGGSRACAGRLVFSRKNRSYVKD